MCPWNSYDRPVAWSAAVVVLSSAAVLLLGLVAGCGTQSSTSGRAQPAAARSSSLLSPSPAAPGTASRADEAAAVKVARSWTARWLRPSASVTSKQWVAGLAGLSTPEAVTELRTVDPQNNPATRITGVLRVHSALRGDVTVDVPTDAGVVRVVVVDDSGRWLVNSWDEAQ